ncbi:hypothetical protein EST35_0439 [Pseudomonas phage vB_PaeM_PA5oct]|uniref:Uncharacterized protein n=1 Tax=Pseudomonas phage vB_PaeM_PA5oct TaxID=2163605 RepID=A0A4Y5JUF8_9CAUD|nr:hypothetical protein PQE65_gp058 [Pseudomonas phage vB_PaeM_PA5oct]QCG76307.1 hypothetical protein EST35_0439 [Pseudomonas phage vB_PaeM_PA5oct]
MKYIADIEYRMLASITYIVSITARCTSIYEDAYSDFVIFCIADVFGSYIIQYMTERNNRFIAVYEYTYSTI